MELWYIAMRRVRQYRIKIFGLCYSQYISEAFESINRQWHDDLKYRSALLIVLYTSWKRI